MTDPVDRFNSCWTPEPYSGCWLWTATTNRYGYGQFRFDGGRMTAHRAAWILFVSLIPDGLHVLHHCDVPSCVNPSHLFLGTHQDNMRDRDSKGRKSIGQRNGKSKLTPSQVIEIRDSKEPAKDLSKRFGIAVSTVYYVRGPWCWKWL